VALLGVGGAVVATLSTGSSDDSAAKVQNVAVDAGTERNSPALAPNTEAGSIVATDTAGTASASDVSAPIGGGVSPTATIGAINGPVSAVPEVRTQDDLRTTVAAVQAPVQPSFEFDCTLGSTQDIVAEITWKGTPAVVVRDTVTGVITALDAQCTALATVTP
jgi:hypothetical protein